MQFKMFEFIEVRLLYFNIFDVKKEKEKKIAIGWHIASSISAEGDLDFIAILL